MFFCAVQDSREEERQVRARVACSTHDDDEKIYETKKIISPFHNAIFFDGGEEARE